MSAPRVESAGSFRSDPARVEFVQCKRTPIRPQFLGAHLAPPPQTARSSCAAHGFGEAMRDRMSRPGCAKQATRTCARRTRNYLDERPATRDDFGTLRSARVDVDVYHNQWCPRCYRCRPAPAPVLTPNPAAASVQSDCSVIIREYRCPSRESPTRSPGPASLTGFRACLKT